MSASRNCSAVAPAWTIYISRRMDAALRRWPRASGSTFPRRFPAIDIPLRPAASCLETLAQGALRAIDTSHPLAANRFRSKPLPAQRAQAQGIITLGQALASLIGQSVDNDKRPALPIPKPDTAAIAARWRAANPLRAPLR
jgi:hypothetical protein